jgi:hypothetical protein
LNSRDAQIEQRRHAVVGITGTHRHDFRRRPNGIDALADVPLADKRINEIEANARIHRQIRRHPSRAEDNMNTVGAGIAAAFVVAAPTAAYACVHGAANASPERPGDSQ